VLVSILNIISGWSNQR